jgi:hypothetical protein
VGDLQSRIAGFPASGNIQPVKVSGCPSSGRFGKMIQHGLFDAGISGSYLGTRPETNRNVIGGVFPATNWLKFFSVTKSVVVTV